MNLPRETGSANEQLADFIAEFYADPLGFVLACYPWGEPGPLENETGPDENQRAFLTDLGAEVKKRCFDGVTPVEPIRMAETSGHGTGKSVRGAWISGWILSTRPNSIGTVTAGTYTQLEGRTWAAIQHWAKLCITAPWFDIRAGGIFHKINKETWKILPQTCRPENAQSFAGQHARTSTSWYMADEASEVDDEIFRVMEGGLTDGEPMVFMWGQPVRNTGKLYRVCFGGEQARWNVRRTDSRLSRFTNKALIEQWIQDQGIDSDWVRVRVLGLPPRASELQFIDQTRVNLAQERPANSLYDDPLICGVDVSGGGEAWTVARFRKGFDARSIPPIRITGEETRNRDVVVGRLAEALRDPRQERKITAMFIDAAFGAPIAVRLQQLGYYQVHEVNFGGGSPDSHDANHRAYMWRKMKDWMLYGAIPSQKDDQKLEIDLTGPGYHTNRTGKLVIESKADMQKRGVGSPDDADALCFVAGTMIRTPSGERPIETIRLGDEITTPFGTSRVAMLHGSRTEELTTVEFSNGARLESKPDHHVFSFSRGKIRIDALTLTDEVEPFSHWRLLLWRLVNLSNMPGRNFGFQHLADTFNPGARLTRKDFFIAGFGQTILDLYQKVLRFITGTGTGVMTSPKIMNCGLPGNTSLSTCGSGTPIQFTSHQLSGILSERSSLPRSGTPLGKDGSGIANTVSRHGRAVSRLYQNALNVESSTKPSSRQGPYIAPAVVNKRENGRRSYISRTVGTVHSAARSLWRTVIGLRPVVPVFVQTANVLPTETFNLSLLKHNAYYANGILVFNCLTFAQEVAPPAPSGSQQHRYRYTGAWS